MKVYGYLPISAVAKFSMTAPSNWNEMSKEDQDEYFICHAKRDASLCTQCAKDTATDYDVDHEAMGENEIEWWEE